MFIIKIIFITIFSYFIVLWNIFANETVVYDKTNWESIGTTKDWKFTPSAWCSSCKAINEAQNSALYKWWAWTATPASGDAGGTAADTPRDPLDEASDLARDTRTEDEIAAANQKALDDAIGWSPKEEDTSTNNILWIQNNDLRNGNVDMDTIPKVIISIINVLLWVAGTISIVSLMYHAVKMQINSGITWDSSWVDHAKKWMIGSIIGFVVAIMAWFIVIRFIEILSWLS